MGISIGGGITIEGGITIVSDYGYPYNTVAPVISVSTPPNVRVGKTLTSTTGTWIGSLSILGYYYQWYLGSSPISGATANTYVIQSSDLGGYITCQVSAYSSTGTGAPSTSNSLGPVLPAIIDPALGSFVYGGYYSGKSGSYYIIVSNSSGGQNISDWNSAYLSCQNLTSNGYSDWTLPTFLQLQTMRSNGYSMPSGQGYNSTPGTTANYWPSDLQAGSIYTPITYPTASNTLITTLYFAGVGTNFIYANNTQVSHRAIRLQLIPT